MVTTLQLPVYQSACRVEDRRHTTHQPAATPLGRVQSHSTALGGLAVAARRTGFLGGEAEPHPAGRQPKILLSPWAEEHRKREPKRP